MKILIAPDKFKQALTATEAADAIAAGIRAADENAEIDLCPMADGGEGSGEILASAMQAREQSTDVLDPLARPRLARWWQIRDRGAAIIEMAEASGLGLLRPNEFDPSAATSFGTGQLLRAAVDAGCDHIFLCVGGSATVDGGAGCLQALGWRFLDAKGRELENPVCGGALRRISALLRPVQNFPAEVTVLYDVTNPLVGALGAAEVFAEQKGATPAQVIELSAGLAQWAKLLQEATTRDVSRLAGGGAAGGIAAGLAAALQARLEVGFDAIARAARIGARLHGCDLCITGEGRIDAQTAAGKVVAGMARVAREAAVPCVALCGAIKLAPGQSVEDAGTALGLSAIFPITPPDMPLDAALRRSREFLTAAAMHIVSTAPPG